MKILYAIQGKDRGRLARAKALIPQLQLKGEVDVLVSGEDKLDLGYPIKYQIEGLSFVRDASGKINFWKSIRQVQLQVFLSEIKNFPVEEYDLVINDQESLSAWSALFRKVTCISIGNEIAHQSRSCPQPSKEWGSEFLLKYYAPSQHAVGMHYRRYEESILPPFITDTVQSSPIKNLGHYTVYLPDVPQEEIVNILQRIRGVNWELYSEGVEKNLVEKNVKIIPFSEEKLTQSIATGEGCLCDADFQLTSEVLYLEKKLMVISSKQNYNAAALKKMGVPVIHKIDAFSSERILSWIERNQSFDLSFTENAGIIAQAIFSKYEELEKESTQTDFSVSLPLRLVKSFFF